MTRICVQELAHAKQAAAAGEEKGKVRCLPDLVGPPLPLELQHQHVHDLVAAECGIILH